MEIRILAPDDAAAYWHIRQEALEREPEAFSSSAEEHRLTTVADAAANLGSDPATRFLIGAFQDGELVGIAGFYREQRLKTRHKGNVVGVYVTERARGRGIGRMMMQALLDRARGIEGVEQVVLSVTTTMTAAARLYQSLGFRSFGCEPKAIKLGEKYADTEYMVLELSALL
ncbi:MAG TPA: GNAT family N-acetyltransferase [Bryobacteraceae bacterium]|nr:GNAT family N-acetyltransferase [Bryobacteraceae bacterium]